MRARYRRSGSPLLACLALLSACSGASQDRSSALPATGPSTTAPATAAAPAPELFVLVQRDAPLYSKPSTGSRVAFDPRYSREEAEEGYGEPFKYVGETGDFVEVESLGDESLERHCTYGGSFLGMHVRVFVERADLVPVTTRRVDVSWINGTAVSLAPGVSLGPRRKPPSADGKELHAVVTDGFRFLLDLPSDAVGITYTPGPRFATSKGAVHVRREAEMLFGVGVTPGRRAAPPPPEDPESASMIAASEPQGELIEGVFAKPEANTFVYAEADNPAGRLVELRSPCGSYRVIVAPEAVVTGQPHAGWDTSRVPRRRISPDKWRAPAGSSLFWPDGSPAGTLVTSLPLPGEGESYGGRRCWKTTRGEPTYFPRMDEKPLLVLCFDPASVVPWPEYLPDRETARIGPATRRYVILEVVNHTAASNEEITLAVRAAAKNGLLLSAENALAPDREPAKVSEQVLVDHRLKGYRIQVEIPALRRTVGKKNPDGSEHSGMAEARPSFRVFEFPSGKELWKGETLLGRSVWVDEVVTDGSVVKESLLGVWQEIERHMAP